jgi:hypothetical protein
MLRCLTPEQVRKEIWTHVLAYNLIRTIMAQAASAHGIEPRTINFKGTLQLLEAFQPVIAEQVSATPSEGTTFIARWAPACTSRVSVKWSPAESLGRRAFPLYAGERRTATRAELVRNGASERSIGLRVRGLAVGS